MQSTDESAPPSDALLGRLARLEAVVLSLHAKLDLLAEHPASEADDAPLTTWARVARAVGASLSTLMRRRKERKDRSKPYFQGTKAARDWYDNLLHGPVMPAKTRAPARSRPVKAGGETIAEVLASGRRRRP